jgi:hypothetical protein
MRQLGVAHERVAADADLAAYDVLVVGKSALTLDGPAPDIARVGDGLRVLLFEQTAEVLEKRFGFRVAEYGLRSVFTRAQDHPFVAGLAPEHLRDWRGAATLVAPRLAYETRPRHGPTVRWCDIPVSHLWRCGNRGNVASVLIEKPARGDFLPVLEGGFGLQYSPLLEYREGGGLIVFCQLDVTGRTETDPAAETLARNILTGVAGARPAIRRRAVYVGEEAGKTHLESIGIRVAGYRPEELSSDHVLIVGPGGATTLAPSAPAIADWLAQGGHLLAIGLDEAEAGAVLPLRIRTRNAEHIATQFEPAGMSSLLAGIGPADVHNRDPRELPIVEAGASVTVTGDGVLAQARDRNIVFCQLVPWRFGGSPQPNLRKTYRRSTTLLSRLLANMGVAGATPLVARFSTPVTAGSQEKRWQEGLYVDQPEEWDDPYRFFRW